VFGRHALAGSTHGTYSRAVHQQVTAADPFGFDAAERQVQQLKAAAVVQLPEEQPANDDSNNDNRAHQIGINDIIHSPPVPVIQVTKCGHEKRNSSCTR
jgi:hypothetical protein